MVLPAARELEEGEHRVPIMAVDHHLYRDGEHYASLWPRPEWFEPKPMYGHAPAWEQDVAWAVRREEARQALRDIRDAGEGLTYREWRFIDEKG